MSDEKHGVRATISVGGRFHAFHLARRLQERGVLNRIITGIPRFALKREGVDRKWISCAPIGTSVFLVQQKIPFLRRYLSEYSLWLPLFDLESVPILRRHLREGDVFHGWAGFCKHALGVAGKMGCVKFVERSCPHVRFQDDLLKEEGSRFGLDLLFDSRITDRMLAEYELTDYVVVPSCYTRDTFVANGYPESKIKVVRLGFKPHLVSEATEKPDDIFGLVFVGGNPIRKGLYYLLKAWDELRLPHSKLLLRGSTSVFQDLMKFNVQILPYLEEKTLLETYAKASVFCLPSIDDGFGMVVLDAMSQGLPVIVAENVGAKDVVRDGIDGFVVPIRDVEALKEKIELLYRNKELREEMGRNARRRALEFSWERYGDEMIGHYHDALGQRSCGTVSA